MAIRIWAFAACALLMAGCGGMVAPGGQGDDQTAVLFDPCGGPTGCGTYIGQQCAKEQASTGAKATAQCEICAAGGCRGIEGSGAPLAECEAAANAACKQALMPPVSTPSAPPSPN
jgi:hypothetical protein